MSQDGPRGAYQYRALRDELAKWAKAPARWMRGGRRQAEEFWALEDVDFTIQPGEVVGSGEIRMTPEDLTKAFGRPNLQLTIEQGRVLNVRFSGKRLDASSAAAHVDVTGDLPPVSQWRR